MLEFDFVNESGVEISKEVFEGVFEESKNVLVERIKTISAGDKGKVCLVLVNDEKIHALNKKYRDKDAATDVLSFAYLEGDRGVLDMLMPEGIATQVGDIFISVETAEKQAKEKGHALENELCFLFVHGILHLLGFQHNTDEQEKEMEKWAMKIIYPD